MSILFNLLSEDVIATGLSAILNLLLFLVLKYFGASGAKFFLLAQTQCDNELAVFISMQFLQTSQFLDRYY